MISRWPAAQARQLGNAALPGAVRAKPVLTTRAGLQSCCARTRVTDLGASGALEPPLREHAAAAGGLLQLSEKIRVVMIGPLRHSLFCGSMERGYRYS